MRFLSLAALFVMFAVPAQAFPHITVTSTEVYPPYVRTTFALDMLPPTGAWRDMWIQAQAGTRLFGCDGVPAGFQFQDLSDPQTIYITRPGEVFHDGDHFDGFSIITDSVAPCVVIRFSGVVLMEDFNYTVQGCLNRDGPVPAAATTWGQVKSLYR